MWLHRVLLLLLLGAPALALAQEPSAVVSRYLPAAAEHAIQRADGTRSLISLGSPVFAGDIVEVLDGGSVVLAYTDGETEELSGATAFTVPDKAPMGFIAQVFGRLQTVLGREYRQGANLATRGGASCADGAEPTDLRAPALPPTTRLGPGHEDLSLAWSGGCAPYELSITATPGRSYAADRLARPLARLATPGLDTGEYRVTVRDAAGREIVSRLFVHEALPAAPFAADPNAGELSAVAYAAWLADHEDGAWRWESFQVLRPWIRRGSTLAGTYGDLLLWGDPGQEEEETEEEGDAVN